MGWIERMKSRMKGLDAEIQLEAEKARRRRLDVEEAAAQRTAYLEGINNTFRSDLVTQVLERSRIKEIFSVINAELLGSNGKIVDENPVYIPTETYVHYPSGEWSEVSRGARVWTYVKPATLTKRVSLELEKGFSKRYGTSFVMRAELKGEKLSPVLITTDSLITPNREAFLLAFRFNSQQELEFLKMMLVDSPSTVGSLESDPFVDDDPKLSNAAGWQELLGEIYSRRVIEYIKDLR